MVSQLAEKDAEIAGCKAKLTEQEEYISKMKEQSEKGKKWLILNHFFAENAFCLIKSYFKTFLQFVIFNFLKS